MSTSFKGFRVWPNANGFLNATEMNLPGAYGRAVHPRIKDHPRLGWWQVTCPDGTQGSLNPEIHTVTEHADGSITVEPSLDFSKAPYFGWHGWLRDGVFITVSSSP
jgi:hypothetical protein